MPGKKKLAVSPASKQVHRGHALRIALLWIGALLVYSNCFDSGMVFDNAAILGQDPRIRAVNATNLALILDKEYWYPADNSGLYRPLTTASYLVNYAVLDEGTNPAGYHAVNLALHEINIALVYALGWLLWANPAAAFAMAALWAVHPLLTESVTNIVGRADLLAGFGVLAGLLCHARAAAASGRRRIAWLVGLAAAQTVGIFSKESAAVLPGVMVLYDLFYARRQWRNRLANYAVVAVPLVVFAYLRSRIDTHMIITFAVNPIAGAPFFAGRIAALEGIGRLLWLFLWPARLSADYSFNAIPLFAWTGAAVVALAGVAALIALAIRFRRNRPMVFLILVFFLALLPTSNLIFPIGAILAERFMYLPAVALCGLAALAFQSVKAQAWIKWSVLAAVCVAFGARTYARNLDWQNEVTLWSSTIAAYPDCARAHYNLGRAWAAQSQYSEAIHEYETALRILPDYPHAHVNLGVAFERTSAGLPRAIAQFETAVRQDPASAEAHYDLGDALARAGDVARATPELQTAVRLNPDFAEAHNDLGALASGTGRYPEAIAEYQAALRANPDYANAHSGLGGVYLRLNRPNDAATEFAAAVRIRPESAEAHLNLGNALSAIPEQLEQAMAEYAAAIRLRPDLGEPHYRMGMALLRAGRAGDALGELETALRIQPDPQGQRMVDDLRARLRR